MRRIFLVLMVFVVAAAWSQVAMHHGMHKLADAPIDRPAPMVEIRLTRDDADGFNLQLMVKNFRFTPENANRTNVANEGHAHLYLNGEKVARLYSDWRHLPGKLFGEGLNRVRVELNGNDHSVWAIAGEPISDEVLMDPKAAGNPVVHTTLRYRLSWNWAGARKLARGWQTTNDLGYAVEVRAGRLTTRSIELMGCHALPMASMLFAYAGHGLLTPDKSKITKEYTEELDAPSDVAIESRTVTAAGYCQGHYLVGYPAGGDLSAPSLEVDGVWRRGGEAKPFHVRSRFAYGLVKDLASQEHTNNGSRPRLESDRVAGENGRAPFASKMAMGRDVDVAVERSLGQMFQGVDFARMDAMAQGRQMAKSLVNSYRFVVR